MQERHLPQKALTPFGQVELRIPRDRQSWSRPSLFAPYTRRTVDLSDLVLVLSLLHKPS